MKAKKIEKEINKLMDKLVEKVGQEEAYVRIDKLLKGKQDSILPAAAKETELFKAVSEMVANGESFVLSGPKNSGKKFLMYNVLGEVMHKVSSVDDFEFVFEAVQNGNSAVALVTEEMFGHNLWQFVLEQAKAQNKSLVVITDFQTSPPNSFDKNVRIIEMNRKWIEG